MMLYPSDHQITIEELRELVYDDGDTEIFDDDRYQTWIDRYPGDWRMAAIAATDRMLGYIAASPNRLSSDGDSIGWSDARVTELRNKYAALVADVNGDGLFGQMTVTQHFLTGSPAGGTEW